MSASEDLDDVKEVESGGEEAMPPPRLVSKEQITGGLQKIQRTHGKSNH